MAGLNAAGDAWVPLAPVATVTGVMEATGAGKDIENAALRQAAGTAAPVAASADSAAAETPTATTSEENPA